MVRLVAKFPVDRSQQGTLTAFLDDLVLGSWPCLGKADNAKAAAANNRERSPLKPFGDTPCGTWNVRVGTVQTDTDVYGCVAPFTLWPTGGEALASHLPENRRSGIWIHSGELNAAGLLRPTYGCIRVAEETMVALHAITKKYGAIKVLETVEAAV